VKETAAIKQNHINLISIVKDICHMKHER